MPAAVILAAGDFPSHPECLLHLRNAARLVCCDSAAEALYNSGILANEPVIVGDLDSLTEAFQRKHPGNLVRISDQETNDLTKAFRYCLEQGWTDDIVILGATGRREDHTLANISLLADFAVRVPSVRILSDYGRFDVLTESREIDSYAGEQVSLFSLNPVQRITSAGLRYPLKALSLSSWWSGTLNESLGDHFRIEFTEKQPLILYRPWPQQGRKHPAPLCHFPWKRLYFCGIGGVGMAGLAQLALDAGCEVSGSDHVDSHFTRLLRHCGAQIHIGQQAENIPSDCGLFVYSSAVSPSNCERQKAFENRLPQIRRGAFLARIAPFFKQVVAIAGSHGKTTVSAMLAFILRECGLNAGYMVGGIPENFNRTASAGDWDILVTEVDESDGTQQFIMPYLSVILNIDDDHSWALGGTEALDDSFALLAEHSLFTLAWDTPSLRILLKDKSNAEFLSPSSENLLSAAAIPRLFGLHNRMNATIAVAVAQRLGVPRMEAISALAKFTGVQRRQSIRFISGDGNTIILEDYAHHPTELEATLKAVREKFGGTSLTVVFQPHRPERVVRYGERFGELLSQYADCVMLMPTFQAWENTPETDLSHISEPLRHRGKSATHLSGNIQEDAENIIKHISSVSRKQLVAFIGAGDISLLTQAVLNLLQTP